MARRGKKNNNKRKIILYLVLIILLLSSFLVFDKPAADEKPKLVKASGLLLEEFIEENADAIEINFSDNNIILQRVNESWLVASDHNYQADTDLINELLAEVKTITLENLVSRNAKNHSNFGVDQESGIEINIKNSSTSEIAHFFIGGIDPAYLSSYVKLADDNKVYLSSKKLDDFFRKTSNQWKDKTVVVFEPKRIKELAIINNDIKSAFIKEKDNWLINNESKSNANDEKVEKLLVDILSFEATEFIKSSNLSDYGLNNPDLKIYLYDGDAKILLLKKKADESAYYIHEKDTEMIFEISNLDASNLQIAISDYFQSSIIDQSDSLDINELDNS